MHPRNPHRDGYDFAALVAASPELGRFVRVAPHGGATIDFADAAAVKALNRALLRSVYGVTEWDIPAGYLCPPVPGRADLLHHLADLLAEDSGGAVPRGEGVAVLDVGVGANCIYPLLGQRTFGWRFVGSEVDPVARRNAAEILGRNPEIARRVELRTQPDAAAVFRGVVGAGERFAATVCNPPFHASAADAASGTRRKLRNLRGDGRAVGEVTRNFGGRTNELWCAGGELAFVRRMIRESVAFAGQVGWFTTLVSRSEHVPALQDALRRVRVRDARVVTMAQGQKRSRMLAWRF
jgi:23S rRNA (adenine1618-N6)-methyltransferase